MSIKEDYSINKSIFDLNENNGFYTYKEDSFQELNLESYPFYDSDLERVNVLSFIQKIPNYCLDNKQENESIKEKNSTEHKTPQIINNKNDIPKNQKNNKVTTKPVFYSKDKIKQLFNDLKDEKNCEIFSQINSIFEENKEYIDNFINELFRIKRKKSSLIFNENFEKVI